VPYAPIALVNNAVEAIEGASPLSVVSIPALLRAAVATGADPLVGVPFGSGEETALFDEYFAIPRPPDSDRPWRAIWSGSEPWQKRKYPGGVLQRLRTDASGRGRVLIQTKQRPRDLWRLTPSAGAELTSTDEPVRLVDLALWFGRGQDVADLDDLVAWFKTTFHPQVGDLVGTLYTEDIPAAYRALPFEPAPDEEGLADLLGAQPAAPTVTQTLDTLVAALEQHLQQGGFELPAGLTRRVLTAWLRGDFVVLVGQPGTGKTMFASLIGRAMEAELDLDAPLLIPVRSDFDEAEFLGYERLDGSIELRDFARLVLQSDRPLEARVVILEEFNLAIIESYLASLLVAAQERERLLRLPGGEQSRLPVDTFVLATCNSFRDEPETRTRVSSPTKRRSSILTMPNVLAERVSASGPQEIVRLAVDAIRREAARVMERGTANASAQFDGIRAAALTTVTSEAQLSTEVRDALTSIGTAILETVPGKSWFTMGLLRDTALEIAYAERHPAAELEALGRSVADKLVHQLRGSHADAEPVVAACAALPNVQEIQQLVARMMDGPPDELLPLL
jgi:hypothetical protein